MELPIYLRRTPMTYTIINAHSRKDPDTGLMVHTQSLVAKFRRDHPGQVAKWEPGRMIDNYIRNERTSGKIEPTQEAEDERRGYLYKVITKFIEDNMDFKTGIIWKAPTEEDIRADLEKRKEALEAELKKYEKIEVTEEDVKKATERQASKVDPKVRKTFSGGGVSTGGSTSGTSKRG